MRQGLLREVAEELTEAEFQELRLPGVGEPTFDLCDGEDQPRRLFTRPKPVAIDPVDFTEEIDAELDQLEQGRSNYEEEDYEESGEDPDFYGEQALAFGVPDDFDEDAELARQEARRRVVSEAEQRAIVKEIVDDLLDLVAARGSRKEAMIRFHLRLLHGGMTKKRRKKLDRRERLKGLVKRHLRRRLQAGKRATGFVEFVLCYLDRKSFKQEVTLREAILAYDEQIAAELQPYVCEEDAYCSAYRNWYEEESVKGLPAGRQAAIA